MEVLFCTPRMWGVFDPFPILLEEEHSELWIDYLTALTIKYYSFKGTLVKLFEP